MHVPVASEVLDLIYEPLLGILSNGNSVLFRNQSWAIASISTYINALMTQRKTVETFLENLAF